MNYLIYIMAGLSAYLTIHLALLTIFKSGNKSIQSKAIGIFILVDVGVTLSTHRDINHVYTYWLISVTLSMVLVSAMIIQRAVKEQDWGSAIPLFMFLLTVALVGAQITMANDQWLAQDIGLTKLWPSGKGNTRYVDSLKFLVPTLFMLALWLLFLDHIKASQQRLRIQAKVQATRDSIINEIHDGIGSRVNLLIWRLRQSHLSQQHIESELHRCLEELRFVINPKCAGHETLHNALFSLVQRLNTHSSSGVNITYERTMESDQAIASDKGLHLYKATQECVNNALKHSCATAIHIALIQQAHAIQVVITDNGHGIQNWNNLQQKQTLPNSTSIGLKSLHIRLKTQGGQCHIQSSEMGTKARLSIPV